MSNCFIWRMDNKNRVPNLIFKSSNEEDFKEQLLEYLKDKKHSYGFRIERYEE